MNLKKEQSQAIYQLYPSVVSIRGDIAYDVNENEISYDIVKVDEQAAKNNCKLQAQVILSDTDWTTIPDIALPENNPYLTNQQEFIAYRNIIRGYAVNPVADPVWPTPPTEQWSS